MTLLPSPILRLMGKANLTIEADLETKRVGAREVLDAWVREMVEWHFNPERVVPSGWISPNASAGIRGRRSKPTTTWIDSAFSRKTGCGAARSGAGSRELTPI